MRRVDKRIERVEDLRDERRPSLSVLVVTYRSPQNLGACLESLRAQTLDSFEVILVHNGGSILDQTWQQGLNILRIDLDKNYRQLIARNVGARFVRGDVIYFIDDDTIVDRSTLEHVEKRFAYNDVVAARSRMLAKNPSICNSIARHFDLGGEELHGHIHENGFGIRTSMFQRIGGYDEQLSPGFESYYMLYRLTLICDLGSIKYLPGAVIRTDFARSLGHFLVKRWRYARSLCRLAERHPEALPCREEAKSKRSRPGQVGARFTPMQKMVWQMGRESERFGGLSYRLQVLLSGRLRYQASAARISLAGSSMKPRSGNTER